MRALSASINAGCDAPRVIESETALEDWMVLEGSGGFSLLVVCFIAWPFLPETTE
jgi:hypothetical protein